ncbi:probable ADP-ribosylation factor GTPase-activating protein agd14 [Phtheirospermum japonicum]|uniref:Probable ADP-ribosylation factor GTPase-activating protein agd14 n=1 Tax=Phtheirospermum japonicum TaxID=374723 RepID=A0A830BA38_9LAMI|nr:probable ADP-ribosylation factor GTPase-activating protein agd14 [Phtheirospermum japonicum]
MKLPPNRRCINCNSMGPQYVCTNFWTFVCITCSGIHREFTHRVKSVSMAKFTSQEVDALQSGGNQRARELYLKAWDPQKNRVPDNSNVDKVREFIKKVYVDKLYFQEKSTDRPPRDPQSLRSHEDQTRRASSYHSYSQSPPYDFQYEERRYGGKHGPALTRKPGSDRGLYEGKLASFLSPTHSSDLANDEGFANEGSHPRYSDYSVSGGSPLSETSRDISNEASQLHKAAASGSFGSFDSGTMSFKSVNSLDDLFSGLSQQHSAPSAVMPNDGGWATFDMMPQNVVPLGTEKSAPVAVPSSDGNVIGSFNPFSADERSSYLASSAHGLSALSTPAFGHESESHTHVSTRS